MSQSFLARLHDGRKLTATVKKPCDLFVLDCDTFNGEPSLHISFSTAASCFEVFAIEVRELVSGNAGEIDFYDNPEGVEYLSREEQERRARNLFINAPVFIRGE